MLSPSALPLYEGTRFNLTCLVSLPAAVDVGIIVTGGWSAPNGSQVTNTNRITSFPIAAVGSKMYRSAVVFAPVDDIDMGQYTCSVFVAGRNPLYGASNNSASQYLNVLGM